MKQPYLDTSLVVKLLVSEPLSDKVLAFLQERRLAVPYTKLIEIETVNTLFAKAFRKEMTRSQLKQCQNLIGDFLKQGRFFQPVLSLDDVAAEALKTLPGITGGTGCRTLDLMHVASAKLLGWREFVSTDKRQLQAAKTARLKPVDLTTWTPPGRS